MTELRPYINYLDKPLSSPNKSSYRLSMELSDKEFSYSLFDAEKNQFTGIVSYKFPPAMGSELLSETIEKIINESEVLSKQISSSNLVIVNNKQTLVPTPLFNKENIDDYFSFSHAFIEKNKISANKLKQPDAYNVFSFPSTYQELLSKKFPNIKTFHCSTVLINTLLSRYRNIDAEAQVFVDVMEDLFYVTVIRKKELLLCNSYNYHSPEDFIYYLLLAFDLLKLNPEKDKVVFSGKIERQSRLFQIAYKYIRNIGFINRDSSFKYSHALNELPSHSYFNLLNVNLCE